MIWNREFECMERAQMRALQEQRLRDVVSRVYHNVPYYKNAMDQRKVKPEDIKTLDDLRRLPFTTKIDLRDNYPFGLFAQPLSEIVRLHASSGTTGKPTTVGYTENDVKLWAEVMARTMASGGVGKQDIVQVAFGYGLFTGGLGAHYGAERVGASVIPMSGGNTQKQLMLMKDFGSTALACTPSYALMLAEAREDAGYKLEEFKLKYGVFGAEPWSEEMRRQIETRWGIRATDIYGLSEIIGPGVAYECECQSGLHICEDVFLPELINPVTLEPVREGEEGELVFTTITKEGMPLLRYRTRDITRFSYETCACGRTLARMEKVLGRSDDMLIIRGVNVFPSQIESVLVNIAGVEPHYLLVVDRVNNSDTLEVHVEVSQDIFFDEVRKMEDITKTIRRELLSVLGLSVNVKLVEPKSIERFEGKAKHVIDKRKI